MKPDLLQGRGCAGACRQGRTPCATPQACLLPDDEYDTPRPGAGLGWVAALLVGAVAAFVVLVTR